EAEWEDILYTVTVTGGTSSVESGIMGTSVTLTADAAPAGQQFKQWNVIAGDVVISDDTFTIGTANVVIEAEWEDILYTVTVTGGTSSVESGIMGTTVTLTADAAPAGQQFKQWNVIAGGVTIAGDTFTIGTADVEIEAEWEDLLYTVTVTGGTSSVESGIMGASVTLTAGTAPAGQQFKQWNVVAGGVPIAGDTFHIGTADVEIEAEWGDIMYTVTVNGSNLWNDAPETVKEGEGVSFFLIANENFDLPLDIVVVMGGVTLDSGYIYDGVTGLVTIPAVTGDVTITVDVVSVADGEIWPV
ncbi:MAG: hypothetical protein LBI08_00060, partial [Methanomassiliicoccaceae archaeon]|nr:hypothetical protein [Methanomassiliicoccaceae archaeon]